MPEPTPRPGPLRMAIILLGHVHPDLARTFGDYDALLGQPVQAACPGAICEVVPLIDAPEAIDIDATLSTYDGVIFSGGRAMVTDGDPWVHVASQLARAALKAQVPTLGVCLGHQLLAHAAGGLVGPHSRRWVIGTEDVALTAAASADVLLGEFPAVMPVGVSHQQAVLTPPPGATILATLPYDPHHALRIGRCAWGVQFHPEFDADFMREAARLTRSAVEAMVGTGHAPGPDAIRPSPEAGGVLGAFARYCEGASRGIACSTRAG